MGRLAIFDYGIGGFDLYKRIKSDFPNLGITYFSDSGEVPYGKLDYGTLSQRVKAVISFLKEMNCSNIIVACHSASTVLQDISDDSLINMIDFTKNCLPEGHGEKFGIIGGGRTVDSNIYKDHFSSIGYNVVQNNAQTLSILIESGWQDKDEYLTQIRSIVGPLKNLDFLLLACTHYPVLMDLFKKVLHDACEIIDPMDFMYDSLRGSITDFDSSQDRIYTTGNIKTMAKALKAVYGLDNMNLNSVELRLS